MAGNGAEHLIAVRTSPEISAASRPNMLTSYGGSCKVTARIHTVTRTPRAIRNLPTWGKTKHVRKEPRLRARNRYGGARRYVRAGGQRRQLQRPQRLQQR